MSRVALIVVFLAMSGGAAASRGMSTHPAPALRRLEFEAASVKAVSAPGFPRFACQGIDGLIDSNPFRGMAPSATTPSIAPMGRCVGEIDLQHLITVAYASRLSLGGADWVATQRFQIEAKAEHESQVTRSDLRQMIQALLADRFKLKAHKETKESSGYALLLANRGPKLTATAAAQELPHIDFTVPRSAVPQQTTIVGKSDLASLAQFLVPFVSQGAIPSPVADKTGLRGVFDYSLTFRLPGPGPRGGGSGDLRDALAAALQDQLGLRLEAAKIPEEILIVDYAEKPTEN
jgi:uncharacterized protein (TIGR03435 family)